MLIKSYFDNREYERLAAAVDLSTCADRDIASLALLAAHLGAAKRESATSHPAFTAGEQGKHKTPPMSARSSEAERFSLLKTAEAVHSKFSNDSIINYLYALIVGSKPGVADNSFVVDLLVRAIRLGPYNWAAWLELAHHFGPIAHEIEEPLRWMDLYRFYELERLKCTKNVKGILARLPAIGLPNWTYVLSLEAMCHHELRNFDKAIAVFERIVKIDPFCISGMDIYSNCLFVKERASDLFQLANHVCPHPPVLSYPPQWLEVNPNAPQTCVLVGNYYSLKSDHEKAALFFKRATVVDSTDINAWLLLGHELIELRNPSAALAAYQQATKCPSASMDVRPWYAMGQLFELINQFAFAIFYHNKAVQIDSNDSRMWKALANCYLKLNRADESEQCNLKLRLLSAPPDANAMAM